MTTPDPDETPQPSRALLSAFLGGWARFQSKNGDKDGDESVKVIMSGFGIGLSLGVADAYISPKDILPIIQTDITWDEGRSKVLEANAKSKK